MNTSCRKVGLIPAVMLLLNACSAGSPPGNSDAVARGRLVWQNGECAACHGASGEGTAIGPSLDGLAQYWEAFELEAFLEDPQPRLQSDVRLAGLSSRFEVDMPGLPDATDNQRSDLALFLLHGLH